VDLLSLVVQLIIEPAMLAADPKCRDVSLGFHFFPWALCPLSERFCRGASVEGEKVPCVTSIAGPNGDA
jgi:hypothetical protein